MRCRFQNGGKIYMYRIASAFKISQDEAGGVACLSAKNGELVVLNLFSEKRKTFPNVADYIFSPNDKSLLLKYASFFEQSAV